MKEYTFTKRFIHLRTPPMLCCPSSASKHALTLFVDAKEQGRDLEDLFFFRLTEAHPRSSYNVVKEPFRYKCLVLPESQVPDGVTQEEAKRLLEEKETGFIYEFFYAVTGRGVAEE